MIEVEGRVLAGLDEFMLRVGHLMTLTRVAHDMGASWRRIYRELAQVLSGTIVVPSTANAEIAQYLAEKKLCSNLASKIATKSVDKPRYSDLEVYRLPSGDLNVRSTKPSGVIEISWQDRNLANRRVRSRVGAITWSAKAGSKTGLSHVTDWARLLEIVNSAGQLSPTGRLMVTLTGATTTPYEDWNPYVLGTERIFLAFEYFRRDLDIFARFAPKLLETRPPLTKSVCQELFVAALTDTSKDAEKSRSISPRHKFELHRQLRDLERSARRSDKKMEETSTAWHRAASRLEALTDFGLLEKGKGSEREKYQYIYYPTDSLIAAIETLRRSPNGDTWLLNHLSNVVLGCDGLEQETKIDEPLLPDLSEIVRALSLPTTLLPIYCLALGLVYLRARKGARLSLQRAREALEALPAHEPDVARLARGREGTRAEFLSVNLRKMTT